MRTRTHLSMHCRFHAIAWQFAPMTLVMLACLLLMAPAVALAEGHVHEWGSWELSLAPSYLDSGERTRACETDPSHLETEEVPRFGPADANLEDALAGDESYGDGIAVRLLYTRPYALVRKTSGDEERKLYQSVPIGLDNPLARGNDIAIRYTGDAPTLAVIHMGKGTNLWKGWTTKYADKTVDLADGSGQHVALYSWRATADKWGKTLDDWKREQLEETGTIPPFDSMCLTVSPGQECHLVEIVSLSDTPRSLPAMRAPSQDMPAMGVLPEMRAGYNLSGHMESNWESPNGPAKDGGWGRSDLELEAHWSRGTYITEKTLHDIHARGFRCVRLPVSWFQHVYPLGNDPYHIDRAWMQRVHEIVDWCLEENLYVIVNTHHEPWLERATMGNDYEEISEELVAIWEQIATEFDGYDQRLVFEGMNEPHSIGASGFGTPTTDEIHTVEKLNEDFVSVIRGAGQARPESRHLGRIIMVTAYAGSGDAIQDGFSDLMEGKLLVDYPSPDRLVVSAHSYAPHAFTHFGNELTLEETIPLWSQNAYTAAYRDSQDRAFHRLRHYYTDRGIPVILGEFGSFYCGEGRQADRLAWMETHVTYLKQLGIPGIIWGMDRSWSETGQREWNIYDEDKNEWSPQSVTLIDRWFEILSDDDIPWGDHATVSEDEHMPLVDGTKLMGDTDVSLEKTLGGSDDAFRLRLTPQPESGLSEWTSSNRDDGTVVNAIENDKEIAISFEGTTPYLWLCSVSDKGWKNWQKLEPRDVTGGIAYWPCDSLLNMWGERRDETSDEEPQALRRACQLTLVYVATDGRTDIHDARLLNTHAHEWEEWELTRAPTCTETGTRMRLCNDLPRHSQSEAVDQLGHDWGTCSYEWAEDDASCSASCACQRCGEVMSETAPATRTITQFATETIPGEVTIVTDFTNDMFEDQRKVNPIPQLSCPFSDVTVSTPHREDILVIADRGITTGWTQQDGSRIFKPSDRILRCDMAAFLFRMAREWGIDGATDGWTATSAQKTAFSDVTTTTPHAREIWWLATVGVTTGWKQDDGSRTFRPYDTVKRQDMAAFLFRLAMLAGRGEATDGWIPSVASQGRFRDVNASTSHAKEIWWLAETGISIGWTVNDRRCEFRGGNEIIRCDMAAFVRRELELAP